MLCASPKPQSYVLQPMTIYVYMMNAPLLLKKKQKTKSPPIQNLSSKLNRQDLQIKSLDTCQLEYTLLY